jgi:hypothetical protein
MPVVVPRLRLSIMPNIGIDTQNALRATTNILRPGRMSMSCEFVRESSPEKEYIPEEFGFFLIFGERA